MLLTWSGFFDLKSGGFGKAGVTRGVFDLVSECDIEGNQGFAKVIGYTTSLGVGAPLTQTRGTAEFEDGKITADPLVFWGRFTVDSIGLQVGPIGLQRTNIYLGNAVATDVDAAGFDFGIQIGIWGFSEVVSFDVRPCSCND